MAILIGLLVFYKKLIVPSSVVSSLLAGLSMAQTGFMAGFGLAFIFTTPVFHYFTYDVRNPNEYYFYYNLGLSKLILWVSTITLSLMTGLILCLL